MVDFSDIVGSGYYFSNPINLRINMDGGVAHNDNNEIIFHMEKHFSHRRRRILQDASGKSICIMHKKKVTGHGRWEVYKGDDRSQLSFIVKRSSTVSSDKSNIVLEVFLANNIEESVCRVRARRTKNSCQISTGPSILAQADANMENEDVMNVLIEANVDLAFVVAVLMIVDEKKINKLKNMGKVVSSALGVMCTALTVVDLVERIS